VTQNQRNSKAQHDEAEDQQGTRLRHERADGAQRRLTVREHGERVENAKKANQFA
jgi:hypothetical protein